VPEAERSDRGLIDRAAYGICRTTLAGRFLDVNPALVAMLGYDSADALLTVDIPTEIYRDPADRATLVADAFAGRFSGWAELRWRKRDRTPIIVRLSARAVHPGRDDCYLEEIVENISEHARREEIIRRNERLASLAKMLAGVAHELNNPLAAIGGFAQLLLQQTWPLPESERTAVQTIQHESIRAGRIVKDLLSFARRPDRERLEPVEVNEVVRYVLDTQRSPIEGAGIRTVLDLAPDLPPTLGQSSQIEQAVLHLVVNARQALEQLMSGATGRPSRRLSDRLSERLALDPPTITIRTASENGNLVLEVRDNGPGIRDDHRARIWDPFWTTKDEGQGTGLGLSVVHGIVTGFGGTVDVESEVGLGTRFTLRLPAVAPH
jgi:signal transduction histidine kinase